MVYAYDRAEARKREQAAALLEQHVAANTPVLSTQVPRESYNALQRAALLSREAALEVVELPTDEHVVATDAALVVRALRLAQQHRVTHWDGVVVQTALEAGCSVLYTEDLEAGRRFGDLEVVNPFIEAAHEPRAAHRPGTRAKHARNKGARKQ